MADAINWHNLAWATDYYCNRGYTYKEVPWMVDPDVSRITCGQNRWIYSTGSEDLIGSAEQGFLQLHMDGALQPGKYVSCSPCFRREDELDKYHQTQFMKVELINTVSADTVVLHEMISNALAFMTKVLRENEAVENNELEKVPTTEGYDILLNGIEVGSYGIRSYEPPVGLPHLQPVKWVYGTGYASPRFTQAMKDV